jgi:hypothetical protein
VGTKYVEMIAVMAKYNPFAEKAGMKKIAQQQTVQTVAEVSKVLFELGFDLQLLGSQHYVQVKLENLLPLQIAKLKDTFIKNKHPRFKKSSQPAGTNRSENNQTMSNPSKMRNCQKLLSC